MDYYDKYIEVLKATLSYSKDQYDQRKAGLERQFGSDENELKNRFKRQLDAMNAKTKRDLYSIEVQINALVENNLPTASSQNEHIRRLTERRDDLEDEYNSLSLLAREKAYERARIRNRLWKFWWSSSDD